MLGRRLAKDKVALVTGATQGLGYHVAKRLAQEGAAGIMIVGRNQERGQKVVAELESLGAQAAFTGANLENVDDCKALVPATVSAFGRLDYVVNSAGLTTRGGIETATAEFFDQHMAVNARAPFLIMQAAVNQMQKQGSGGSIVNMITKAAYGGVPFLTPYSTSKGALAVLTKNVAYSQRQHRIRVNGIMLGWMDTPGEDAIQKEFHDADEDWLARAEAQQPLGKLIKPDEVADLTVLLLSDRGGVMTGSLIEYDQSVVGAGV